MDDQAILDAPVNTEDVTPPVETTAVEAPPPETETTEVVTDAVSEEIPAEENPFDDVKPDKVEGKLYSCSETKWNRMWGSDKFKRAVDDAVGPGVTPEIIAQHWKRSLGSQALLDDWHSGEPDSVERATNFLLEKAPPATVAHIAEKAMALLPKMAPDAYQQLTGQVQAQTLDSVYQQAVRSNDTNLFKACQNMELALTGKYRTEADFQAVDPRDQQFQTLQQQLSQYQAREQEMQQRHYQSLAQEVDQHIEQAKSSEIEKVIPQQVAEAYKGKPEWNQLNLLLKSEVDEALNSHPIVRSQLNRELRIAKSSPSAEARAVAEATVRGFAANVLARRAKPIIDKFAANAVAANAKMHSAQAKLQARREPTGLSSAASPNSNRIAQWKAEGLSFDEQLRRFAEG